MTRLPSRWEGTQALLPDERVSCGTNGASHGTMPEGEGSGLEPLPRHS